MLTVKENKGPMAGEYEVVDFRVPMAAEDILDGTMICVSGDSEGEPRPILRPLAVATTITRSEFEREVGPGWRMGMKLLGTWGLFYPVNVDHTATARLDVNNSHVESWHIRNATYCRRPGSDVDLKIVDDAKPEPAFPPAGTVMECTQVSGDIATAVVSFSSPTGCTINGRAFSRASEVYLEWKVK